MTKRIWKKPGTTKFAKAVRKSTKRTLINLNRAGKKEEIVIRNIIRSGFASNVSKKYAIKKIKAIIQSKNKPQKLTRNFLAELEDAEQRVSEAKAIIRIKRKLENYGTLKKTLTRYLAIVEGIEANVNLVFPEEKSNKKLRILLNQTSSRIKNELIGVKKQINDLNGK